MWKEGESIPLRLSVQGHFKAKRGNNKKEEPINKTTQRYKLDQQMISETVMNLVSRAH